MNFIDIKKQLPKYDQLVLIKTTDNYVPYYVTRYSGTRFVEASGEEYSGFYKDEVVGWLPIEELDKIEVK